MSCHVRMFVVQPWRTGDSLVLKLQRRKNKSGGSRLVRGCWCTECKLTCPLHVLGPLVDQRGSGKNLFPGITAASALTMLREMLEVVGAQEARSYRTHDSRRGHAKDLQVSGWPAFCFIVAKSAAARVWRMFCLQARRSMRYWPPANGGVPPSWRTSTCIGKYRCYCMCADLSLSRVDRLETDLVIEAHMEDSESDTE